LSSEIFRRLSSEVCQAGKQIPFALLASAVSGEPLPVRHMRGFIHGFVVLKDSDDKILASGDVTQTPAGNRLTEIMTLRFKDGSLYQATTVFSQRRIFQLLKYKQVQKGPSFKRDETLSLDTASGNVNIQYIDKDGKTKNITDRLSLPPDLANGMIPTLMGDIDPKAETTLSMLASTPKPRVVRLKISVFGRGVVLDRRHVRQSHAIHYQNRYWRRHRCGREGCRKAATACPYLGYG
jgi:hypothetical protein